MVGIGDKTTGNFSAPVDDIEHVQVLQRAKEFCCVESAAVLIESSLALEVIEQFATVD